ncbi:MULTISPECIES: hypothetical protein [Flagellimonas]|uniref:HEPN domain-containing protein n=1 Tax=Flagellimonas sediminis TaxID=2696468 RepID=A0A6I5KWV8_9FLAO|nr:MULTISPECIES: hypothetical protein [Allomuricauda]NDV45386.1 hypothetical protein [Allomuricauda sediminis]
MNTTDQHIIDKITEELEIDCIHQNKDRHVFKHRLDILARSSQRDFPEQVRPVIDAIMKPYPDVVYSVFTTNYARKEAQEANLYFLNNCNRGSLVYKNCEDNSLIIPPDLEPNKLYETAKREFKRDMARLKSYRKGASYFRELGNLPQSAFMLHQTFEQGYRILERFICGRIKICHSIKNHQSYVLKMLDKLGGTFQMESDMDSKLLDLLEDAYSSARYTHSYTITKNELEQLTQKLSLFTKDIKTLFHRELSIFKRNIDNGIFNHKEELDLETPNAHRTTVEPYVRRLEFDNSFEMLCKARSLLLLGVTCLQEDVEPPLHVNGFDYNIVEVLQLAIELLPLKETSP